MRFYMFSPRGSTRRCSSTFKLLLPLALSARNSVCVRFPLPNPTKFQTGGYRLVETMSYSGAGGGGRGEYYRDKYGGGRRGRGGGGGGAGGGRGEYYKNKYGGGGRGRGGGGGGGGNIEDGDSGSGSGDRGQSFMTSRCNSRSGQGRELIDTLRRIDNRPYPAYKDTEGSWSFGGHNLVEFTLCVDKIQSDPFAAPSRFHVVIPGKAAGFPKEAFATKIRKVALCDFLTRRFLEAAKRVGADKRTQSGGWSGAKGGEITIDEPGQHILERSSVLVDDRDGSVEARFSVAMPARGRSICGGWAAEILGSTLPELVQRSLYFESLDSKALREHVLSSEDQEALRGSLRSANLVGFVINGAILPRESGNSDRPMAASKAVPFKSPPSLERSFTIPNRGTVTGMGIPPGVTLVVGGGFHGKSTLEVALQMGCYNHIPGDGREFVVVEASAVKVRAEDGRCVTGVDISPFIDNLPFGKSTKNFTTPDASGSTSQATNIIEALEAGCTTLLVDEDTCATNFMIRDLRMQMLVSKDKEPITPFISKVRALYDTLKVSSVLVIGGCGDYFEVADTVIMMDCYSPKDVTAEAKRIAADHAMGAGGVGSFPVFSASGGSTRIPSSNSFICRGKLAARGANKIQYGDIDIDLSAVEQLVEASQTRAVGDAISMLAKFGMPRGLSVPELLDFFETEVNAKGLDALMPGAHVANYARPRRFEVVAALNRFREGKIESR